MKYHDPCAQDETPANAHAVPQDTVKGSAGLHALLDLNPVQEATCQTAHASEQMEGSLCQEKVVLSYGINSREVGLHCLS